MQRTFNTALMLLWLAAAGCTTQPSVSSKNYSERIKAVEALATATDTAAAVRKLAPVLRDDPDAVVRSAAADTLGKLGSPDAMALLLEKAASDDAVEVRSKAVAVLATRRDPSTIPGLIELWRIDRDNDDRLVHAGASMALTAIGRPAVDALLEVAFGQDAMPAREMAFVTLEHIGDASIRDRVAARVEDTEVGHLVRRLLDKLESSTAPTTPP